MEYTVFGLDLRRLVVESLAAGAIAYGMSIGVESATHLSGGTVSVIVILFALGAVRAAAWLWDAKKAETA